jgi:hypothetical protein
MKAISVRGLRDESWQGPSSASAINSVTLRDCSQAAVVHASSASATPANGAASARADSTAERITASVAETEPNWFGPLRLNGRRLSGTGSVPAAETPLVASDARIGSGGGGRGSPAAQAVAGRFPAQVVASFAGLPSGAFLPRTVKGCCLALAELSRLKDDARLGLKAHAASADLCRVIGSRGEACRLTVGGQQEGGDDHPDMGPRCCCMTEYGLGAMAATAS